MTIFKFPTWVGLRRKDPEKRRPARRNWGRARIALGAMTALLLSLLLSLHLLPDKVSLQVGDTSPEQIRAHRTVRYVDTVETERVREEAAARADKVYNVVQKAASKASESASSIFDVVRRARINPALGSTSVKADWVRQNLRLDIPDSTLNTLLGVDSETLGQIESYTERLVGEIMGREIRDDTDDVQMARSEFGRRAGNYFGSRKHVAAASSIANSVIRPNRIFDREGTESAMERERLAVAPRYRQVLLGDIVIDKGEPVAPEHIDKFMALGLRQPHVDYLTVICISFLVASVVIFVIAYLARYHNTVYRSTKLLFLLSLIVIFSVLGLKLGGTMLGLNLSGIQYGYFMMFWTATAGMLTAMLVSPQIAVLVVAFLSVLSGLAMNHELRFAAAALVSSLVAVYAVSDIRHRSDVTRAMAVVCLANLGMVWLIGRISGDAIRDLLIGSAWAVAAGVFSIELFSLGTAALEKPFGITTHRRLLELSDTNNPILKRLLMEAPGTYSHSVFVGNIASSAAEVIGADPLLVRVASYYHDVGKMKRPHFFVENQHVENVHDRLNPSLSALVIRSHVKDGIELWDQYKLPPLLCKLMGQHHGTSLVTYFYHKAEGERSNGSTTLERQFRYEGTKPQSKEAALLMLADAVEAASRTLSKPTLGSIKDMVKKIVEGRLADGQLDESELTFKDISRIRDSFVRTLTSMLHARIEYPEPPGSEAKRLGANGSADKELPASSGESAEADQGREKAVAS